MAAQTGGDDDLITSINVTPLVDVILVLLVIFMVATELIHEQRAPQVIDVDLPAAASAEKLLNQGLLNLVIDQAGQLYMNGEETNLDGVKAAIGTTRQRGVKAQALITADERTPHGVVVELMDTLRLEGVIDIAINTRKQAIE